MSEAIKNFGFLSACACAPRSRKPPKFLFTQIDLHDIINGSTEPIILFITQQIITFLSMKISGKSRLPPRPLQGTAENFQRFRHDILLLH
jgi:hypothetical protein